jgi:glyoxylase-like metal-dependent hydrolase (beta-lactamase superfamily II)
MCAIHIPVKKLLFSGDMLIQAPTPFILHSIQKYYNSLRKLMNIVQDKNIKLLIPGHGKPATTEQAILNRKSHELNYIQSLVQYGFELSEYSNENPALKLYNFSTKYSNLHSHYANVQTLLRERDKWHTYNFLL